MTNKDKFLKDAASEEEFIAKLVSFALINGVDIPYWVFRKFFEQPVQPTLTEDERVILKNIKDYTHIQRMKDGHIMLTEQTEKHILNFDFIEPLDHLFQFIKNGEEYEIAELLKGE